LALARLCYGAITLLLYFPLARQLRKTDGAYLPLPAGKPVYEEA
jgi:hypothetical protein